jgi:hypothetical protein
MNEHNTFEKCNVGNFYMFPTNYKFVETRRQPSDQNVCKNINLKI